MPTYCKDCKHSIQTVPWLCRDTGKMTPLGINHYLKCLKVNDDSACSRFKPRLFFRISQWFSRLLTRIKK